MLSYQLVALASIVSVLPGAREGISRESSLKQVQKYRKPHKEQRKSMEQNIAPVSIYLVKPRILILKGQPFYYLDRTLCSIF